MVNEKIVKLDMATFDNFTLRGGIFFEEVQGSRSLHRAMALHLTQPPRRFSSQNEWHLHILRLSEVGQLEESKIDRIGEHNAGQDRTAQYRTGRDRADKAEQNRTAQYRHRREQSRAELRTR